MNFNSIQFIIFYPIILLLYFLLPFRFRWIMLLTASCAFYMMYDPPLIFLLMFTTLVSWICSVWIERAQNSVKRKLLMLVSVVSSLSVLVFFKYFNFIADSVTGIAGLLGLANTEFSLNLILPIGISFYTFQTLSYTIDVYWGNIKCESHFGYYALFVTFFPQVVAGPIERPGNLIPQLRHYNTFSFKNAGDGLCLMLLGFYKKVVVADVIAVCVDSVYGDPGRATGPAVIAATVLFAVQIYCDFSGYTDIAIGCARIMGINLMQNFNHPYRALSIKEFWARWHISLSSWFKDYIYIPLGGNRCSKARHMFNLFLVFLISGFWHGASWTFVIWGVLHGLYQITGMLTADFRNRITDYLGLERNGKLLSAYKQAATFILVCFAWIIFRANSVSDIFILISRLPAGWGAPLASIITILGTTSKAMFAMILSILLLVILDNKIKYKNSAKDVAAISYKGTFVYLTWTILLAWIMLLQNNGASSFIYFQF